MREVRRALAFAVRLRRYSECSRLCVHVQCSIASATPFNKLDNSQFLDVRMVALVLVYLMRKATTDATSNGRSDDDSR